MPVSTSAVKVNPVTGALIDPPLATFVAANGLLTGGSSDAKESVVAATTTIGDINTDFDNGTTIDGITIATGDRILIKNQSPYDEENGIYIVAASGAPTRATDFDAWTEIVGAFVSVEAGTVNAGTQWLCNVVPGGTIDATAITFVVPKNYVDLTTSQTITGTKTFGTINCALGTSSLGTPNSGTLTNCTGLPAAGVTGTALVAAAIGVSVQAYDADLTTWAGITPGANVGTFLATPSSANLAAAVTDETGSGALVFGTSPTITTAIVAGSATMALLNTTATTVNAFGAATNIVLGGACTVGLSTTSQVYVPLNSLTSGTGLYLASTSLTSGKMLDISTTSLNVSGSIVGLNIGLSGSNFTSVVTTTGAAISNTRTGTSSTNVALTLTASGGTTNNALNITAGSSLFPDGSVSTPSIQFGSDTDTGIYRIGTNNIGIATNGTLRWHVSSGGNLFSGSGNYDYNIGASLVLGSSGSASAPTFSFGSSADTNTGIYRVGEDQLGFTAGGTLRVTVSTTGVTLANALAVTGATTLTGLLTANGGITLGDAQNIAFNTTTGTKIGAATTQKLSFWNATPIVQPTTAVASATVVHLGGGTNLKTDDTLDGYTLAQVVKALRNAGLLA